MADFVSILITVEPPISLDDDLIVESPIIIGANQSGIGIGPKGEDGDANVWEDDTLTTIKPVDGKTINATYISGLLDGGIFQP